METLKLVTHSGGKCGFWLKDSKGFTIGHFPTVIDAEDWCKSRGYRLNVCALPKATYNHAAGHRALKDLREYDKRNPGKIAEES